LLVSCSSPPQDTQVSQPIGAVTDAAGACAAPAAGVGSPLFRADPAGCTDVAAVLYECAPRLDPVLSFPGPDRRVFVGGRFAARVGAVPPTAAYVGEVDGFAVHREPGGAGRVFVEDASGVTRWLPLPEAAGSGASAYLLGDSIALGAADTIVDALPGWSTTIDAVIGRTAYDATAAVDATALPALSAVVVELGTNDVDPSAFAAGARRILRSVAAEPLVVWVAPHTPFEVTADVRRSIQRLIARTSNGVVADWSAAVPPDALAADGVHLLPERTDAFADFVSSYLRAWRMAVTGRGATACAATA
ncbi:MAG TPA: hypothetical protein VEC15_04200, partial [Actinomycetota bacterium]|nr:hypothetical protein [Actinomycetota bacterium]